MEFQNYLFICNSTAWWKICENNKFCGFANFTFVLKNILQNLIILYIAMH